MTRVEQLYHYLVTGIGSIPGVFYCGSFPRRMDKIRLPGVFIDLTELESVADPGTGELALVSHWEARVVVHESLTDSGSLLRHLVVSVMYWLFSDTFPPVNIHQAQLKQASPDHFSQELQGHLVWVIEWSQLIREGVSVWDGDDVVPVEVWVQTSGGGYVLLNEAPADDLSGGSHD